MNARISTEVTSRCKRSKSETKLFSSVAALTASLNKVLPSCGDGILVDRSSESSEPTLDIFSKGSWKQQISEPIVFEVNPHESEFGILCQYKSADQPDQCI